jgi:hypothetical protein
MLAILDDVIDTFGWWTILLAPVLVLWFVFGLVLVAVLDSRE